MMAPLRIAGTVSILMLTQIFILVSIEEISCASCDKGCAVRANFTIYYDSVATDEIVVLQNAIEDDGKIVNMSVNRVAGVDLQSNDVMPRPLNMKVKALSSTKILVSWSRMHHTVFVNGSNYSVKGYTVFVKRYSSNTWMRFATLANSTSLEIGLLQAYTLYTVRMLAYHAGGNGIATEYEDVKTLEGIPQSAPADFICESESPSSMSLSWTLLPVNDWNGFAKEYFISYHPYDTPSAERNVSVFSTESSKVLQGLKMFTDYKIFIRAATGAGYGSRAGCVRRTQEGVPSVGPVITWAAIDPTRPREGVIEWNRIPKAKVNGDLIGYAILWGVTRDGKDRMEYPETVNEIIVDKHTHSYRLKNLDIDIEIQVRILGLTNIGRSDENSAQEVYIETCKCPRSIYAAWFHNPPYVRKEMTNGVMSAVSGIFPKYMKKMVETLCGECNALKLASRGIVRDTSSDLYWDRSKDGRSPVRPDEKTLKKLTSNGFHFHVAINGRSEMKNFQSEYRFVCIVHSPGIAFVVRDPIAELDKTAEIMKSLGKCWPAIIIIILFSMMSGIIMWVLDCKENQEEFPNESFLQGLYHGTYWAFVSMTTVGYGDKTPRSFLAQCVAICWMLMGPIINGIVIGAITTSLTTINLQKDPKLYGCNVAAKPDSFEYNLGVRRNAKMHTAANYSTEESLISALERHEVDGILLDSLIASSYIKKLKQKKLKISQVIAEKAGWGIVLSDDMLKLEEEIRSYEANNAEEMREIVKNISNAIQTSGDVATEVDTGLIDPESPTFIGVVKYGCIAIVVCILLAAIFEFVSAKLKGAKVVPYTEAHRTLLDDHVSTIITDFCDAVPKKLKIKTDEHESELKRFFWKKGYSFGIDGWVRQKTSDEEKLKKDIRYQEIMNEDLGQYKPRSLWTKPKTIVNAIKHETNKAKESLKETMDDLI